VPLRKLSVESFDFFCRQKLDNQSRLFFINCRAFHAAYFDIVCFFFYSRILSDKKLKKEKEIHVRVQKKLSFHNDEN
jgi:hypothetical protein